MARDNSQTTNFLLVYGRIIFFGRKWSKKENENEASAGHDFKFVAFILINATNLKGR